LELLGSEAFTVNHSEIPVNFYALKEKGYTFTDGVLTTRATIQTVRATNYNRDYAARAYVCVNYADGSTGYAYGYFQEENHVRNIYEVASAAYKAEEGTPTQRSVLEGYASKIADITFDGSSFTATENTVGSALKKLQTVSIVDNIVELVLTSDSDSEPLLIINGEAIRSNTILEKAYENTSKDVYLDCLSDNEVALNVYESHGFEKLVEYSGWTGLKYFKMIRRANRDII
jgi:hypothetical protein